MFVNDPSQVCTYVGWVALEVVAQEPIGEDHAERDVRIAREVRSRPVEAGLRATARRRRRRDAECTACAAISPPRAHCEACGASPTTSLRCSGRRARDAPAETVPS